MGSVLPDRSHSHLVVAMHHITSRHFYLFVYFEKSSPREGIATHNAIDVCTFPVYTRQSFGGVFSHFFPFAVKKNSLVFPHKCIHTHVVTAHDTHMGFNLSNLCMLNIY